MSWPHVPPRIPLTFLDAVQLECRGSPPPSGPANELEKLRGHIAAKRLWLTTVAATVTAEPRELDSYPDDRVAGALQDANKGEHECHCNCNAECLHGCGGVGFRWFTCEVVKADWSFSLLSSAFRPTRGLLVLRGLRGSTGWTWTRVSW